MQHLEFVSCDHTAALIVHLHFDEILDKVVDAAECLVLTQLVVEAFEAELDLVEVREAAAALDLLHYLHEVVLTVLRDVARGHLAARAVLQALRLCKAEPVGAHRPQRQLQDHAEQRDPDALVLDLLAVDLRLDHDAAL